MIRPIEEREIPQVKLTGTDGNAFAIMGKVRQAMHAANWTPEEMASAMDEMMSGDYDHLLMVACDFCDVL